MWMLSFSAVLVEKTGFPLIKKKFIFCWYSVGCGCMVESYVLFLLLEQIPVDAKMIRKNWEEREREERKVKRWTIQHFSKETNKKCIYPEGTKMFCRINHEQHANQNHKDRFDVRVYA